MNDTRLHSLHTRLTKIFTWVVFLIVLVIGTSLTLTTHISEAKNQRNSFSEEIIKIIQWVKDQNNFFQNFFSNRLGESWQERRFKDLKNDRGPNRVSFFVINNAGQVIFQNILENPDFENIDIQENTIVSVNGFYVFRAPLEQWSVIFYASSPSFFIDFFEDMLVLLVLSLLFSGLMYYIWYQFVYRALMPLEENLDDMKSFIHNAGHELKTPLAVMRGNLQIIEAEKKYDESLIHSSIKNVDTMNGLIEWLRELSEIWKLKEQEFLPLADTIWSIISEFSENMQAKSISLDTQLNSKYSLRANKHEIHMLVANILGNAIKYSPANSKIFVLVKKNILEITDTGPGMSEAEKEKIFDRFYQGSAARNVEWFWIGLSLVRKIADSNKWKLELESELWKWTTFRVIF